MTRPVYQRGVRFASTGTKRLSNLLCSTKWPHAILEQFLWRWAGRDLSRLGEQDEMALAIWDESVLEKPGSIPLEGLYPVHSSKEARLKRIMPGYYNPRQDRRCLSPACGPTLNGSTRFAATCCTIQVGQGPPHQPAKHEPGQRVGRRTRSVHRGLLDV